MCVIIVCTVAIGCAVIRLWSRTSCTRSATPGPLLLRRDDSLDPGSARRLMWRPLWRRLAEYLLVDGYRLVLDAEGSHGSWLVDARDGREFLDLYTHFASAPLGANPLGIVDDPGFMALLARVAVGKPANPDMYTTHLAEFVETFARVLGDPALPHLFFVEGGALAVENALKTAFDWKSRRNEAAGRSRDLGTKVLHLTRAFHSRSGYTMSLTNAGLVSNVRGRGLMCAMDLPDPRLRDRVIAMLRGTQVLVLACGERAIRFRPALNVTTDELKVGVRALDDVLGRLAAAAPTDDTDEMRS